MVRESKRPNWWCNAWLPYFFLDVYDPKAFIRTKTWGPTIRHPWAKLRFSWPTWFTISWESLTITPTRSQQQTRIWRVTIAKKYVLASISQVFVAVGFGSDRLAMRRIGRATNPTLALFNHSCDPNYRRISVGRQVYLFFSMSPDFGDFLTPTADSWFRDKVHQRGRRNYRHLLPDFCRHGQDREVASIGQI